MLLTMRDELKNTAEEIQNMTTAIEGFENISYADKRIYALKEANEYLEGCKDIFTAKELIRNDPDCFTDERGYVDTGNLYLDWCIISASKNCKEIFWQTRLD